MHWRWISTNLCCRYRNKKVGTFVLFQRGHQQCGFEIMSAVARFIPRGIANHLVILVVRSMDRSKLTTMLSTFTWGLCYERRGMLLKQIPIKMATNKKKKDVEIARSWSPIDARDIFYEFFIPNLTGVGGGEVRGDEYIIILRVIIERRLFVEKGTGLRQIKENSAPSSQLPLHGPPTTPAAERSCLGGVPNAVPLIVVVRVRCTGENCHRDRSPTLVPTTGLIPLPPLRARTHGAYTRALTGRQSVAHGCQPLRRLIVGVLRTFVTI